MTTPVLRVLPQADLRGADLRGQDLAGRDLRGAHLEEADLRGVELSGADLTGADLRGCRADGAGFASARLDGAVLCGASLVGASFTGASLTNTSFQTCDLTDAFLVAADLTHADLASANLTRADFGRSRLDDAVFRDADLTGTRFRGATGYTHVNWSGVNILAADLDGAHLFRRHVSDELYLEEFRNQSRANAWIYRAWSLTSDCGRSMARWMAFTGALTVAFAVVYALLPIDYGEHRTWLSPLYFSVVTLTTLGFGDALPTDIPSQVAVMLEVVLGYLMLGGLISILSNKMARRA
ncbi:MAG: pentapeptide repeat-containing protein [Myxococcales bacterium]|nr:pentapeptide repeat-containing protein [Myxococcales bacterium]